MDIPRRRLIDVTSEYARTLGTISILILIALISVEPLYSRNSEKCRSICKSEDRIFNTMRESFPNAGADIRKYFPPALSRDKFAGCEFSVARREKTSCALRISQSRQIRSKSITIPRVLKGKSPDRRCRIGSLRARWEITGKSGTTSGAGNVDCSAPAKLQEP